MEIITLSKGFDNISISLDDFIKMNRISSKIRFIPGNEKSFTKNSLNRIKNDVNKRSVVSVFNKSRFGVKISDCFSYLREHTGDQAVVKFARSFCAAPEDYWLLRKRLSNDFATFSMVQWLLQLCSLGPQQYLIDVRKVTLQVWSPELDLFDHTAPDTHNTLPFRLNGNIVQFIQPSGDSDSLWKSSSQPFTASMIGTGYALYWGRSNLMALIRALLRDYMILYDKSMRYSSPATSMDNGALEKWLSSANEQIYKKISGVGTSDDDDSVVKDQIQISLDVTNQASMPASYQPWI